MSRRIPEFVLVVLCLMLQSKISIEDFERGSVPRARLSSRYTVAYHFVPNSMTDSSSSPSPSQSASTQSDFERWRRRFGYMTGLVGTPEERQADLEQYQGQTCEKWKTELMNYSQ